MADNNTVAEADLPPGKRPYANYARFSDLETLVAAQRHGFVSAPGYSESGPYVLPPLDTETYPNGYSSKASARRLLYRQYGLSGYAGPVGGYYPGPYQSSYPAYAVYPPYVVGGFGWGGGWGGGYGGGFGGGYGGGFGGGYGGGFGGGYGGGFGGGYGGGFGGGWGQGGYPRAHQYNRHQSHPRQSPRDRRGPRR